QKSKRRFSGAFLLAAEAVGEIAAYVEQARAQILQLIDRLTQCAEHLLWDVLGLLAQFPAFLAQCDAHLPLVPRIAPPRDASSCFEAFQQRGQRARIQIEL